jgi:NAD(P)-dependent dehydrogenase (short-subunit alcohol dehydrogenase family)
MDVTFDFSGDVALVTGACGALGSAVAAAFDAAGATVCGTDLVAPDDDGALVDPGTIAYYEGDFTDEDDVVRVVDDVVADTGDSTI